MKPPTSRQELIAEEAADEASRLLECICPWPSACLPALAVHVDGCEVTVPLTRDWGGGALQDCFPMKWETMNHTTAPKSKVSVVTEENCRAPVVTLTRLIKGPPA